MNLPNHARPRSPKLAPEQPVTVVRRLYESFDSGRLDDFTGQVDPHFAANVLGNTDLDWQGFKAFGESFRAAFPDGRHVFEMVVSEGDAVVTIGTYEGTHLGDMQGIGPTGRMLSLKVMHYDRVVDGKLVEHRGLANQADFMAQLGIG